MTPIKPAPSPKPPEPSDHQTGEVPATRREMRKTVRGWAMLVGTIFTSLGVGGGTWLHNASSTHVEERTAALEAKHDDLRHDMDELRGEMAAMRIQQASDTQEILEAVKGKH